ncbi:MAG: AI-2E family transporter [Proteobacteria bacterium]|nr:AI-2E family transporter [Pseudomonadota bacterium]
MTTDKITTDNIIRFGLVALIVVWSITIIAPFVSVLLWAVIIAISAYPAFFWLSGKLGDRSGLAATVLVFLLLALLVGPIVGALPSFADSIHSLAEKFRSGTLTVPAASENIRQWPLIGEPLYALWQEAATNLSQVLDKFRPQLRGAGVFLLGSIASASLAVLQFIVSIIIAGVILAHHKRAIQLAKKLFGRIAPESKERFLALTENTVRGVTMGVVGVAIVQAILAGIGFAVIGIPAAAFWAFACLILAILQISIVLVVAPIAIYVFSSHELLPALLFVAWNVPILALDNILKPILMGRGVDAPMLVIFIGAIGGLISFGFLGLFFGAVVLVIAYDLMIFWLDEERTPES